MTVPAPRIAAIRRFNRFYTRRIGVLREGVLDSPFSLTEVRVLYELAQRDGTGASELATELDLDPGYLSRILQRFERKRYLVRAHSAADRRRRVLRLTSAGRRAFEPLDRRSRREVATMVATLDDDQQLRLLDAMAVIGTTLGPVAHGRAPVTLRGHRPGDIGWAIQRHGELYAREYGWDESFEALVAEIAARFVRRFDPARERCWIAERDGRRLGCVFLVAKSHTVAKLRMLLVEPEARGLGLGRRLVDACVTFARRAGYRRMTLWTQSNLDAARHLYASAGFRKVAERPHDDFAKGLVAETWDLRL